MRRKKVVKIRAQALSCADEKNRQGTEPLPYIGDEKNRQM